MNYLLDYTKWKKINEQASPVEPLDFVVSAGTDKTPMRDDLLHTEQKFPKPSDSANKNHVYELTLEEALLGKFSSARIIAPSRPGEEDQIVFEGRTINGQGKISIEWNPNNLNKPILVSGNGALAMARANSEVLDDADLVKMLNSLKGVIVLEMSAKTRYSSLWSIVSAGLLTGSLRAALNGIISQVVVQTANPGLKLDLQKKFGSKLEMIETKYSPSIFSKDPSTKKKYPLYPQLAENAALRPHYEKYSAEEFLKGNAPKILAPLVKTNMIDPGMEALSNYVEQYFAEKLIGLDRAYVARMISSARANISAVKAEYTEYLISNKIKKTPELILGGKVDTPEAKTSRGSTEYEVGKSSK